MCACNSFVWHGNKGGIGSEAQDEIFTLKQQQHLLQLINFNSPFYRITLYGAVYSESKTTNTIETEKYQTFCAVLSASHITIRIKSSFFWDYLNCSEHYRSYSREDGVVTIATSVCGKESKVHLKSYEVCYCAEPTSSYSSSCPPFPNSPQLTDSRCIYHFLENISREMP